eukprot:5099415-Amphidinium_carterae.1
MSSYSHSSDPRGYVSRVVLSRQGRGQEVILAVEVLDDVLVVVNVHALLPCEPVTSLCRQYS